MGMTWLHTMDNAGRTPLDRALGTGHRALVEAILATDNPAAIMAPGATPLHRAAAMGLTTAIQTLLLCGADVKARDTQGETALHYAVREGHLDTVHALLERSDPNAACNRGLTPLHWASITGRADLFELLVVFGGDPFVRGEYLDGLNAIDVAASMDYREIAELLEEKMMVA